MPVDTGEILDFLSRLAQEDQIRVTVTQAGRGAIITGAAAGAGGLVAGPIGLVVGAVCGSLVAVATGRRYDSIYQVLTKMDPEKKELLANNVRRIMRNLQVSDAVIFAGMITDNPALRRQVVDELIGFLRNEMHMVISNR